MVEHIAEITVEDCDFILFETSPEADDESSYESVNNPQQSAGVLASSLSPEPTEGPVTLGSVREELTPLGDVLDTLVEQEELPCFSLGCIVNIYNNFGNFAYFPNYTQTRIEALIGVSTHEFVECLYFLQNLINSIRKLLSDASTIPLDERNEEIIFLNIDMLQTLLRAVTLVRMTWLRSRDRTDLSCSDAASRVGDVSKQLHRAIELLQYRLMTMFPVTETFRELLLRRDSETGRKLFNFITSSNKSALALNHENQFNGLYLSEEIVPKMDYHQSAETLLESAPDSKCPVCYEDLHRTEDYAILSLCPHILCMMCAEELFFRKTKWERTCPVCRTPVPSWTTRHYFNQYRLAVAAATNEEVQR